METKELSIEELEKMLADKKKQEFENREKEIEQYELIREKEIKELMDRAYVLHVALSEFKEECHTKLQAQHDRLTEYGKIRSNSKGGFSITSKDGSRRITRFRNTEPYWDERSTKAVDLIKEFLFDTVKKRDKKVFEILISFIEKNNDGDLQYARVMNLVQHENKYDDPRWKEGLALIKESYNNRLKGFGYEFKEVQDNGKLETFSLNFSSI